jgi:hypothetical protein
LVKSAVLPVPWFVTVQEDGMSTVPPGTAVEDVRSGDDAVMVKSREGAGFTVLFLQPHVPTPSPRINEPRRPLTTVA